MFLFFILSFINIPIILGFSLNSNGPEISSIFNALSYFTIGNIGESSFGCTYSEVKVHEFTKDCPCPFGIFKCAELQAYDQKQGPEGRPAYTPDGVPVSR